jgi:hypothetical protein
MVRLMKNEPPNNCSGELMQVTMKRKKIPPFPHGERRAILKFQMN